MVVDSVEIVRFSAELKRVLVEGDIMRYKVFGLVYFSYQISEACLMLLLFVDNLLVKILEQLIIVFH